MVKIYLQYSIKNKKENVISLRGGDNISNSKTEFFANNLKKIITENNIDKISISTWNVNPLITTSMDISELEIYLNNEINDYMNEKFLFINNDYSELVSDLNNAIHNNWILNIQKPNQAYKIYDTSMDILKYDYENAVLKEGYSGVVKHGAERVTHNYDFIAELVNLLQNKENYILFDAELNPISTDFIKFENIDILHEKHQLDR